MALRRRKRKWKQETWGATHVIVCLDSEPAAIRAALEALIEIVARVEYSRVSASYSGAEQAANPKHDTAFGVYREVSLALATGAENATRMRIDAHAESSSRTVAIVYGVAVADRWAPHPYPQPYVAIETVQYRYNLVSESLVEEGIDHYNRELLNLAAKTPDLRLGWFQNPPLRRDLRRFHDLENVAIWKMPAGAASSPAGVREMREAPEAEQRKAHEIPIVSRSHDRTAQKPDDQTVHDAREQAPSNWPMSFWRRIGPDLSVEIIGGIVVGIILLAIGALWFGGH